MNGNGYYATEQDTVQAEEAYINYAAGVAILNDPEGEYTQPLHGREVTEENVEAIIFHAERIILPSLQDVVRYANPSMMRDRLNRLEGRYELALPNMQATVRRVYKVHAERLRSLNHSLGVVRPAPFNERETYSKLCHSRRVTLKVATLLGPLSPAPIFEQALFGRTMKIKTDADGDTGSEDSVAS